jgi:beta-lactam-binding protein with PASTA domain
MLKYNGVESVVEGPKKNAVVIEQKSFEEKGVKKIKLVTSSSFTTNKPVKESGSKMPDVKGMSMRKCIKILSSLGIEYKISGYGKVTGQSPDAGTIISKNQVVIINCGEQELTAKQ